MPADMKNIIGEAFVKMVARKGIDKITVKSLIEECHISRQTFYYHFQDIMDVLEWTFRRSTQELAQRSLEAEARIGALSAYVSFVRQNKDKLEKLIYSRRWVQIEGMLVEAVTIYLAEIARSKVQDIDISVDDMEVMLKFYASGEDHHGKDVPGKRESIRHRETGVDFQYPLPFLCVILS